MDEYIERKTAVEWFAAFALMGEDNIPTETAISDLKHAIPAADVAPAVHGHWVMDDTTYAGVAVENYKCSECGETNGTWLRVLPTDKLPRFCRWCGARMDGGDNG